MDLVVLDYLATNKQSVVHGLPAPLKMFVTFVIIALVIFSHNIYFLLFLLLFLHLLIFIARLPWRTTALISLYPALFALVFAYANAAAGWGAFFVILLRVICAATAMILLFSTTPYPYIFDLLNRLMPGFLSTLFLLSYRAVFILSIIFDDIRKGFYLRKGLAWRRPVRSLVNLGRGFGYLISRGFDTNEKVYEALVVRGFTGKVYHLPAEVKNG